MARRAKAPKEKKRKAVLVKLLERKHSGKVTEAYRLMEELIDKHHTHLREAKIAIAWRFGWKPDADGRIVLGQCRKRSDLDRELGSKIDEGEALDFVILLNHEHWNQTLNEAQRRALMDHELTHAQVSNDTNGEPKMDENGRRVWRIRRHDLEEFKDVVSRHGCYKGDIEDFVAAAVDGLHRPLLKAHKPAVATA
jgi:hypothetical protein